MTGRFHVRNTPLEDGKVERLRVTYAAVVNAEDGTTLPLYDYASNVMHADEESRL